ncbi:hypothetical protein [Clostridium sp. M62/1]|uniref:hypothetical protein n=1 Tax=Clostridium sp. M62/1 TaxID=411486 RepID=UPI001F617222|nr:hypothetical protein [Clostridium sp. M62/1]
MKKRRMREKAEKNKTQTEADIVRGRRKQKQSTDRRDRRHRNKRNGNRRNGNKGNKN